MLFRSDMNVSQTRATVESSNSNACHTFRHYGRCSTHYQAIIGCFYNGVTAVAGIIFRILFTHREGFQGITFIERAIAYFRYAGGYLNVCDAGTTGKGCNANSLNPIAKDSTCKATLQRGPDMQMTLPWFVSFQ